jgi:hypothetical protein
MRYFTAETKLNSDLMKKITLLSGTISLALLSLLLVSCEKEKPLSEAIIGKWDVQTIQQVYFLQDAKKFETTYFIETDQLAYEFTSGGSIIWYEDGDVYGTSNYTLTGNKLVIEAGDEDMEWDKVSVDGNTLTWTEYETDVIDEDNFDVEINFTAARN